MRITDELRKLNDRVRAANWSLRRAERAQETSRRTQDNTERADRNVEVAEQRLAMAEREYYEMSSLADPYRTCKARNCIGVVESAFESAYCEYHDAIDRGDTEKLQFLSDPNELAGESFLYPALIGPVH